MAETFEEFLRRRERASNDYIRGNAGALVGMLTTQDPATFMPPSGAVVQHAGSVREAHVEGADAFGPGSSGHFEVLNSGSSGALGYWTGRQIATMDVKGRGKPIPTVLRTTEVFRLEDGEWRLIHRHADVQSEEQVHT
jgi:ketosteroid isomerase-like protein